LAVPTRSAHDVENLEGVDQQQNERGRLQNEEQDSEDQTEWSEVGRRQDDGRAARKVIQSPLRK
jgi:hypothetical protein